MSYLVHLLGIYFLVFIGIVIMMFVLTMVWIKMSVRGKVGVVFFDDRRIYSMLLPEDTANQCVWRGREDNPNREKYRLVSEKVFEMRWPASLPWFMQERLRAWMYTRNNDEPWDPSNTRIVMSARMNRMVSDEALLRTMWKDLRAATGAGVVGSGGSMKLVLFLGFIALLAGVGMVLTYNLGSKLDAQYQLLFEIYNMLKDFGIGNPSLK